MARAPDPIDVKVGHKIKMRRRLLRITQTSLAAALGVTFQQIQKYEKGMNRVSASRLQKIADTLDVPVWYFFPDHGKEAVASSIADDELSLFLRTNEGRDLNVAFAMIASPDLRRQIIGLVKCLAEQSRKMSN